MYRIDHSRSAVTEILFVVAEIHIHFGNLSAAVVHKHYSNTQYFVVVVAMDYQTSQPQAAVDSLGCIQLAEAVMELEYRQITTK